MSFSFHPEAEEELFGAIDWYEDQEPGLGRSFALEVTLYVAERDKVLVLAVMHLHREPGYWKERFRP